MKILRLFLLISIAVFMYACATTKMQVIENHTFKKPNSEVLHTFYLIGDAGNSALKKKDSALAYLEKKLKMLMKILH